ncbi:hypothetical protein CAOG_004531 [Capsaspora owczarzaki ATCC 30864]|uniref:Peroxisomal leader peptide-processing protease n=1 Tax=Capsaspora owczarzaki (strain ATCC 30864) TaxID=595528 RepID=A0A0D2VS11_CAPO3|nr:hypothetical protein CAOG_004531 [Capsaspora owczarzaki ATCC 30864]
MELAQAHGAIVRLAVTADPRTPTSTVIPFHSGSGVLLTDPRRGGEAVVATSGGLLWPVVTRSSHRRTARPNAPAGIARNAHDDDDGLNDSGSLTVPRWDWSNNSPPNQQSEPTDVVHLVPELVMDVKLHDKAQAQLRPGATGGGGGGGGSQATVPPVQWLRATAIAIVTCGRVSSETQTTASRASTDADMADAVEALGRICLDSVAGSRLLRSFARPKTPLVKGSSGASQALSAQSQQDAPGNTHVLNHDSNCHELQHLAISILFVRVARDPSIVATSMQQQQPSLLPPLSRWVRESAAYRNAPGRKGESLVLIGAPYGFLSPAAFFNSMSNGVISNVVHAGSEQAVAKDVAFSTAAAATAASPPPALYVTDARCLEGMEGAMAVRAASGHLLGLVAGSLAQDAAGLLGDLNLILPLPSVMRCWHLLEASGHQRLGGSATAQSTSQCLVAEAPRKAPQTASPSVGWFGRISRCWAAAAVTASASAGARPEQQWNLCLPPLLPELVEQREKSIVLIHVGSMWATGVVLSSSGLVLTNAHAVQPYLTKSREPDSTFHQWPGRATSKPLPKLMRNVELRVRVSLPRNQTSLFEWYPAFPVFVCNHHPDVALLAIQWSPSRRRSLPPHVCPIQLESTDTSPSVGATVLVLGHSLLGPRAELAPSATIGMLSNVVKLPAFAATTSSTPTDETEPATPSNVVPALIQSSAPLHKGGSGGALFDGVTGRMLGLAASLGKLDDGLTLPRINFTIPCALLEPIFAEAGLFHRTYGASSSSIPITEWMAINARLTDAYPRNPLLEKVWAMADHSAPLPNEQHLRSHL